MRQLPAKVAVTVIVGLLMGWMLNDDIDGLKVVPTGTASGEDIEMIKRKIKDAAKEHYEPPVNARIDRVWKAIPGYNGIAVDEKRTLAMARKNNGKSPLKLVFKEVPPEIQLDDLPAHPIYRGNERKPMAALMVNVAWGTEHLVPMLDIFERENVRVTFFLDGSWLEKHPEEGKTLVKRGHEIGNHAYHHPPMSRLTTDKMKQEIGQTETLIEKTLGVQSKFFAPPSGDYNDRVVKVAADHGLFTVLWTADTVDWRPTSTPETMVNRIRSHVENGTLILMHPTDRTVKALPEIIRTVKEKGLQLGTVAEVLSPKRVPPIEPSTAF